MGSSRDQFPTNYLELQSHEKDVIKLLHDRPGIGKQLARSSIRHLNQAVKTREVDLDMAVLRMLTAEEEAASAILYSLHRLKYVGHDKINIKSHEHRYGVLPFLEICMEFFKKIPYIDAFDPRISYDEKQNRLRISCSSAPFGEPNGRFEPNPPLNFALEMNGQPYHFEEEMEMLCSRHNVKRLSLNIKVRVNRRHSLLYATDRGLGGIEEAEDIFFEVQRKSIFSMLMTYILIDQTKDKQKFVQQCLDAFIKMLSFAVADESISDTTNPQG